MQKWLSFSAMALAFTACQGSDTSTTDDVVAKKPIPAAQITRVATKQALFGDLHVHTKNSFDAYITGTRTTADDAYRFAQGQAIDNGAGQPIQLSGPPLDFYSVTDHGEYMGVIAAMQDKKNPISKTKTAKSIFGLMAGGRENRIAAFTQIGLTIVTGEETDDIYDREFIDSAWAENVSAADKHNQPGVFTTFNGYEFTAMEIIGSIDDNKGALNLHRNVIFEGDAPTRLFTTLVSPNPEDLWDWMDAERAQGRDAVSIPHNSNGSNGQMFDTAMTDGSAFTKEYAAQRVANEPLAEISQIKGTSETHPLLSPSDEWAGHELYEILVGMPVKAEIKPGSFIRQALARGLRFEDELGVNPYEFGFIGSTDAHVSASSLSEKEFFGKFSTDLELKTRGSVPPDGAKTWTSDFVDESDIIAAPQYAAAGLAAVWAESNTREDIFSAFKNKETFATSGPRIKVRFFAGTDYDADMLSAGDMVEQAYARGVPMGAKVDADNDVSFLVWAMRDAASAPLQRVQIVKSWYDGGLKEAVYDVACADGSTPNAASARCAENRTSVDLSTCAISGEGASELKALWKDPKPTPNVSASYYVRVLENPKCRWSTWDAVRNGTPPNPSMDATLQDRAWSSPIWVSQ